jgi:tRNA C32,U32 (ribose-2'-O)-methylase TrmJ
MKRVSRRYMGRVSVDHMTNALNGAENITISRATVARLMNTVHFKRRTLRVKPLLSKANAVKRLAFARENLQRARNGRNIHIAHVDVDEKYFTAHEDARLLLPKEDVTPQRSLQSKRNRPKVMLLIVFGEENAVLRQH